MRDPDAATTARRVDYTNPGTVAYFEDADESGGFSHQRDAYEAGYQRGRAAERQRIREAITSHPQLGEWVDVSDALAAIADLLGGDGDE